MVAVLGSIGSGRIACFQAELTASHKVVPLNGLDISVGVATRCRECIRKDETSNRIASPIGSIRVELSSRVIGVDIDEDLVNISSNCANELELVTEVMKRDGGIYLGHSLEFG